MSTATTDQLLQQLRRLLGASRTGSDNDRALLDQFIATHDATAFTTLVQRHGSMVLGVCRRVLGNGAAVEDVFQATFLVLAQKAGAIRRRDTLGGWLYGVAHRLARKSLNAEVRRRQHERQAVAERPLSAGTDPAWQELLAILDEELQRLPERWRAPLLACYLEGRTQDEAARELGWSLSTLRRRLARGREVLRLRMRRRGVTLSAGLFAGVLAPQTLTTSVLAGLIQKTVQTASAASVPAAVAALAEETAAAAWPMKIKVLAVLLLTAGAAGAWGWPAPAGKPAPPTAVAVAPRPATVVPQPLTDLYGDPLPPGAIARMGTTSFRHKDRVMGLTYSPDGKWLATSGNDYTVRVWETATGREVQRFTAGWVSFTYDLAFAPDSKRLAATTGQGILHVWDIATGKQEVIRKVPAKGKVWTFLPGFRADGRALFAFHGDGEDEAFALYDAVTGAKLCRLNSLDEDRTNLAFSPDGKLLAVSRYTAIDLLALDNGKLLRTLNLADEKLTRMAFARDSRWLAACAGRRIQIFDPAIGKELRRFESAAVSPDENLNLALSPDGQTVALGDYRDSSLRVVNVADGKELARLPGAGVVHRSLAFAPDGRSVAATAWSQVRILDIASGEEWGAARAGHRGRVNSVVYAPDGQRLVSGGEDGTVRLWDACTGRQLHVWPSPKKEVTGVAFSPDGRSIAAASKDNTVIFDTVTGEERRRFDSHADWCSYVAYSPDGRLLALPGDKGTVCLRRSADGGIVHTLTDGQGPGGRMAFSPDGRLLAICHKEQLRSWDVATGKQVEPLEGNPYAYLLAFSPDGQILAAGGYESITLWRIATRKKIGEMKVALEDRQELHGLGYSPDGRMLVLSIWDQRYTERALRFWEVATCRERLFITNPGGPSSTIAFRPDGQAMATANCDGTVTVWDLAVLPEPVTPGKLGIEKLDQLWTDLSDRDAARAFQAVRTLAALPRQAVPLLRERLQPVPRPDPQLVQRLLADLDSDSFPVREKASVELARLHESVGQALRRAAARPLSAEARRRVEPLLKKLDEPAAPERLQILRAIEVLERVGSPGARQVLRMLAEGQPEACATDEARAALLRLAQR